MDALLLGAWTDPHGAQSILDIGTGCGILALMLAARCEAKITALDIDHDSAREAAENFIQSAYHQRLVVKEVDFNTYCTTCTQKFELVISNPPFFIQDQLSASKRKARARHASSLTYDQLLKGVAGILSENGRLCVVLPYEEGNLFWKLAEDEYGLYLSRQMVIFPRRGLTPNRLHLELSRKPVKKTNVGRFVIREEEGHFSEAYKKLLGDFLIAIP
ncbi:MAG: methyltransferase [bacterium]